MKMSLMVATTAAIFCTASMAIAGSPASYNWTFDNDASPAISGTGIATIAPDEFGTGYWDSLTEVYGSAQGWWDIGTGSIVLDMPNTSDEAQNIEIGITYWQDISQAPGVQFGSASFISKTTIEGEKGDMGGGWYTDTWSWSLATGADTVTSISIFGAQNPIQGEMPFGSQIDRIAVNTSSATTAVPEPGSLVALCSGMIGTVGYALKRKRA